MVLLEVDGRVDGLFFHPGDTGPVRLRYRGREKTEGMGGGNLRQEDGIDRLCDALPLLHLSRERGKGG